MNARPVSSGSSQAQEPAAAAQSATSLLTREAARALADRVLDLSTAEQTRVNILSYRNGHTRFADGSITTSGSVTDASMYITATVGRRRGISYTNSLDDESLERTVDTAIRIARLSPDDPEFLPELGPQSYAAVDAYVDATADLEGESRAEIVGRAVDAARESGVEAGDVFTAGFLEANASAIAVATSNGLFAYHRSTDANFSVTARTPDQTGSGWARGGARDWSIIDPAAIGRTAAQKAVASRNPQEMAPGRYLTILEPQAVNDLVPLLAGALGARNADEGRSAFSKPSGGTRVGERVVDERVTLYSDPSDSSLRGQPFDEDGLPVPRLVWIEKGVLQSLAYTRFWAEKQSARATGGDPLIGGLALTGGTRTTQQLVAECERGILVTHFFYIRSLDPRTVLYTGLTRDGVFLIEDGKVTRSLKNFRWNESPLLMLDRLDAIGRPEPVSAGRLMPALRIRDFNFTSLSDAV
ncbi:MAG: TldD/PmbA family protein [Pirellulaceae bacterium]